jgi:hypothetical protein
MARMPEGVQFSGTIGNITFYQMYGRTYLRSKSSLTRKRVLKSRAFAKTRKCASYLGIASRIGSEVYRALPDTIRERWLYRAITGEAASLLYEGKTEQEVRDLLWDKYIEYTGVKEETATIQTSRKVESRLREVFAERWEKQGNSDADFKSAWDKRGYFNRFRFREVVGRLDSVSKAVKKMHGKIYHTPRDSD